MEIGRVTVQVQGKPEQEASESPSQQKKLGMEVHAYHQSYARSGNRRIKVLKAKRAGGVTQVVEDLPSTAKKRGRRTQILTH